MTVNSALDPQQSLQALYAGGPTAWAQTSPMQRVSYAPLDQRGISLSIKREDLLDPRLSGNKLYKLHGHVQLAQQQGASQLVSFGGYYSNHLHALAYLGRACGSRTLGLVRGHAPQSLSPTLQDCVGQGMELQFLSRLEYRHWQDGGHPHFPNSYIIPAGGSGPAGLSGCGAIMTALRTQADLQQATVCVACGTGTTLAGLLSNSRRGEQLLGFSALKLGEQLPHYKAEISKQLASSGVAGAEQGAQWDIVDERHFGGFAKTSAQLFEFIEDFEAQTRILLDPVYTAKLLFTVVRLAEANTWPLGHQLIVIHTGGLQGRRGYAQLAVHKR